MYIRFRRSLHPIEFLKKHARPHLIVGYYDPLDHKDEHGIGPVTYRTALSIVMNGLDLVGECTDMIDPETATLNLMFELGSDATKVGEFVQASPARPLPKAPRAPSSPTTTPLYERLSPIRDARMAAIRAAYERSEKVEHVRGVVLPPEDEPGPIADDWGSRGRMSVQHHFPRDRTAG